MRVVSALVVAGLAITLATCGGDVMSAVSGGGGSDSSETAATPEPEPTPDPTPAPTPTPDATSSSDPAAVGPLGSITRSSVPCAPGGASSFSSTCTVERQNVGGADMLVVYHPDGGFRRLTILQDGSGVEAVAGADEVSQTLSGDILEVSLAGNRYRFPANAQ